MLRKFVVLCCLSLSVCLLPTSAHASGPLFGPRADYSSGFTPLSGMPQTAPNSGSVVTGDFNGDGKMDVVAACNCSNNVAFFAGTGTGNLRSSVTTATSATGGIGQIVAGDFNEDGKLDLLAGLSSDNIILLQGKGDGTFTQTTSVPGAFANARVADLNGDGHLDVVYGFDTDVTPHILLGDGKGNFSASTAPALPALSSGSYGDLEGLALGDFNGDRKLDIVASFGIGYAVYIGVGDGTFAPTAFYANVNVDEFEGFLEVGDFDNDGKLDLLTSLPYWIIQIYHGNGDGTFQRTAVNSLNIDAPASSANANATSNLAEAILPLDIDGDGKTDVVAADAENNFVFAQLNNGTANYQTTPNNFTAAGFSSPLRLAATDLNGDGKPDLIDFDRTNCGVSVFLSSPSASTSTQTALSLSPDTITSASESFTATATVTGSGALPPSGRVILTDLRGEILVGAGTLDGSGKSNFTIDTDSLEGIVLNGANSLVAQYLGDTANAVSVSPATTLTINPGTDTRPVPVVAVTGSLTSLVPGQAITLMATVTNATAGALTGKVVFTDEIAPGGASSSISISGNTASYTYTPTVGGLHTVRVIYNDDINYAPSTVAYVSFTVQTKPTVALTPAQFTLLAGGSTTAKVTVNGVAQTPTGNVTVMDGSATLGTATLDSSGDATFMLSSLASGTHSLTASYAGDANYLASSSAAVSVVADDVAATISTPSQTIAAGGTATYSVSLTPESGFSGTVAFSCTGLPSGYACSSSTSTVTPGQNITATITVSQVKSSMLSPFEMRGTGVLAAGLFLLMCAPLRRRAPRLLLLICVVLVAGLAGCSSGGGGSTTTTTTTPPPTTTTPVTTSFTIVATLTQGSNTTTHTIPASITIQ